MVVQPLYIPVGSGSVSNAFGLSRRQQGGRLQPAMRLGMPVSKGELIRPVVVGARIINHPVGIVCSRTKEVPGIAHIYAKSAVVDRVTAFVQRDVNLRRGPDLRHVGRKR